MFIKYFSVITFKLQLPNINLKQSLSVLVWELIDQDGLLGQTTYQTYAEAALVSCLTLLAGKLVLDMHLPNSSMALQSIMQKLKGIDRIFVGM